MMTDSPQNDRDVPYWQIPRLDSENRLALGVASGIAEEIGIDPTLVRLAFIALFAIGGWGALLYGLAWMAMTMLQDRATSNPRQPKSLHPTGRVLGFGLMFAGLIVALTSLGGVSAGIIWPVAMFGSGILLAWRRIEQADSTESVNFVQLGAGLALAAGGVVLGIVTYSNLGSVDIIVVSSIAALLAVVVLSAPWWLKMVRQLDNERQARARSDERAVVAAHLHDSVLQTLTLIQKNEDPQQMAHLARRQERELRNWLDPHRASRSGLSVRGRLDDIATDIEEMHGVTVEVVAVGDCILDESTDAALAAAREAAINAAKHSGDQTISIYAEVLPTRLDLFVRDSGKGFDPATVASDRMGIRDSINARIARVGGTAEITSAVGEGTEVELSVPRQPQPEEGTQQ